MSEDNLTQIKTEGQPAFPVEDTENDNSADSSSEETNIDQPQSDEGAEDDSENSDADNKDNKSKKDDAGFADHPRWKEREEDWTNRFNEQEKRHIEEIAKLRGEFDGKLGAVSKPQQQEEIRIPSWFGGDEDAWTEYQKDLDTRITKAKEEARESALKEISSKTEEEQKAISEATNYFKSEVSAIEGDRNINPTGAKVDQNKLLKFVLDNDLVDSKGRWNYKAGWRMMQANLKTARNEKLEEKKKIAAASTESGHVDDKPKDFATSEDFDNPQNRPW